MNWANARNSKTLGKILTGAAVFVVVMLLISCSIESPKAPSWDVPVTLPLIDRAYTSAELFEKIKSENIEIAEDGTASFVISQPLEPVGFGSILQFEDVQKQHSEQVGLIRIARADDQQIAYNLADYVSLIAGEVPETGVTAVASIGQPSTFSEAEFAEGDLSIEVSNNTGLALDSVTVALIDSYGEVLSVDAGGGLAVGEVFSTEISLTGKTVSGSLDLETYFHTQGGTLLSLSERSLDVMLSFGNNLLVSSVTGQVDRFDRSYHEETGIEEDSEILFAQLEAGELNLTWTNDLPIALDLDATFPEISNGATLMQLSAHVPANSQLYQAVPLQGWRIEPVNNMLAIDAVVGFESSNGEYVTLSSEDQFAVDVNLVDLRADAASAVLQPTDIDWDQTLLDIEVPTGFEHVSPALVELTVNVQNYSELSGTVLLELSAENGESIEIPGEVIAGSVENPSENLIYSDQLADLLSPIPNQIEVSGLAVVGDGVSAINLGKSDHLESSATISAPMSVRLDDATIEGDANQLDIDADLADKADRLLEGSFQGTITNHLPLGASISIYFAANEEDLFTGPATVIGPLSVNAGEIDADGIVSNSTETINEIILSAGDLSIFRNERLYIAPVIELQGSNGAVVHIRAQDFLEISGFITITTRLGGEDF